MVLPPGETFYPGAMVFRIDYWRKILDRERELVRFKNSRGKVSDFFVKSDVLRAIFIAEWLKIAIFAVACGEARKRINELSIINFKQTSKI